MKIVATSDTHFEFDAGHWPRADLFIHAGDLMYTGQHDEWKPCLNSLKSVDASQKIYVPGNHDYYPFHYEGVAKAQLRKGAGVKMVVGVYEIPTTKLTMLAIPYVTGLPGWAYNVDEKWLEEWLEEQTKNVKVDIVVSHAPMFNVLDAVRPQEKEHRDQIHVGGLATNRWFYKLPDKKKPLIWINGHIHESYGTEVVDGCHFYNVALCDRDYKHTNKPVVIEI